MKILITGASGFIGSHLTRYLAEKGYRLYCLIRDSSNTERLSGLDLDLVKADLLKPQTLDRLPDDIEIVIHLAAKVEFSAVSPRVRTEMYKMNVEAVENLFNKVRERSPSFKRFIHFSSLAAVGFQRGITVTNQTDTKPDTIYGETKADSEIKIAELCNVHGRDLVIIRPSLVYGPFDHSSDFLQSVRLIKKGIFPVFGNGSNIMSPFIYIDDLCEICRLFLHSSSTGTYICAMNEKFTVRYFLETIGKILDTGRGSIRMPVWLGQLLILPLEIICHLIRKPAPLNRRRIKDLSLDRNLENIHRDLREVIAYEPETKLEQGAALTIKWFRESNLI